MKWAVVSTDGYGNRQITGFRTKTEAEKYLRDMDHPAHTRTLYRLVPADSPDE